MKYLTVYTVYIAGPMRGYPRFNVAAFDDAAKRFNAWGHRVISPADLDRYAGVDHDNPSVTSEALKASIRRDLLAIIDRCDAIALLPGWEKSAGVKVEKALAEFLGLKILDAMTGEPMKTDDATPDPVEDRVVTLEVGQEFTVEDAAIARLAKVLQASGAKFSYRYTDPDWQSPDGQALAFIKNFEYRLDRLPVETSDRLAVLYDGLAWYDGLVFDHTETARCEVARQLYQAGWKFLFSTISNGWHPARGSFQCNKVRYRVDGLPEQWIADNVREQAKQDAHKPPSLHIGQVFTGADRELCAVAKKLQDERGAIFEMFCPGCNGQWTRGDHWSFEQWIRGDYWGFSSEEVQYRLVSMTPQDVSDGDESILDEAIRITSGDRQASYGPPDQDFKRTATMWSQLLGVDVEARQVALCMIALKLSRETHQRKRDNWVDIAGYAKCGSLCND